jgi:hypothetical protein
MSIIIIGITYFFVNKHKNKIINKDIVKKKIKIVKNIKKKYNIKSTEKTNKIIKKS